MLDYYYSYPNLRFVKINGHQKKPFEKDWQNTPYKIDEIKKHFDDGNNYGILLGFGDLIIIDCDKVTHKKKRDENNNPLRIKEKDGHLEDFIEKNLPETFSVTTGSGGKHYYFFCKDMKKIVLDLKESKEDIYHLGEIQAKGTQAIGIGSTHPITKKKYVINKNKPIAKISKIRLLTKLNNFIDVIKCEDQTHPSIDDLNITDIFPTSGMKFIDGEYVGSHPVHGSSGGSNFWINPKKNTWNCFRCNSGGSVAKAIGIKHNIIDCSDSLYGEKFKRVIKIAQEEYGLKLIESKSKEEKKKEYLEKKEERKLTPLTFKDFMNKKDKKIYYVKGMFAKSTINMIFSPPKQMKSFVSYYLALCMCQGKPFLNQKTKKVNVGYFDWENPIGDVQNRIFGICKGMNYNPDEIDNLFLFPKQSCLLRVDKFDSFVYEDLREQLIDFIKENDLKVIFFDTLRRLGNFDENDSRTINTIKSELFDYLIKETGICIIFLHHTSKEGRTYRGSVDIEGILDTSFKINKNDKGEDIKIIVSCDARRNNEIDKIVGTVNIETESYEDEDGDMIDSIQSVEFNRIEDEIKNEEDTQVNRFKEYRRYLIDSLKVGREYKNKEIVNLLKLEFQLSSDNTTNSIIKWCVCDSNPRILIKTGSYKSTRYQINPEIKDVVQTLHFADDSTMDNVEKYLKRLFEEVDILELYSLKDKFSEKNLSLIIDKWNTKGWINTAKAGKIKVTELYRGENE